MARSRRIAVLTSGGDAPGMNAAVRAVVRRAAANGDTVIAVRDGFHGLIAGGAYLWELSSGDVAGIIQRGGTVIGTARSAAFLTVEGRQQAVANLLAHDVTDLIVIGGDGSLTGASLLRREWATHRAELVARGQVTADANDTLQVVGIVGSIDNDFAGTDTTIGADTALHRIIEAVDAIHSTAASHQRSFVVEVMGATAATWRCRLRWRLAPNGWWCQKTRRTRRPGVPNLARPCGRHVRPVAATT